MADLGTFRGNPITSCEEDLLDRVQIAKQLSTLITQDSIYDSCTIGVSGQWGSGKTSIINMVRESIDDERIIFVDFNPIDYKSDSESIARLFFDLLIVRMRELHKSKQTSIGSYKRDKKSLFKKTVKTASLALDPLHNLPEIIDSISEMAETYYNPGKYEPIEHIRNKISDLLTSAKIKMVVVIDDMDRLLPGEAIQILKLIRITANFHNVFYILGYDEKVLSKQIDHALGHRYMEKFIQVPIHLPEANADLIHTILYREYTKIIVNNGIAANECSKKVCEAIHLETLRDMYTLLNRFIFKLAMCPKDICPEDLLALTLIEMKDLDLYNWMYQKRFELCRMEPTFMKGDEIADEKNHKYDLYREYQGRDIDWKLKKTVLFIYPHLDKSHPEPTEPDTRSDRVRSLHSCSRYFILNSSSIPVSNITIDYLVQSEDKSDTLYETLKEMAENRSRNISLLLDKILERIDELTVLDCCTIARVLLYEVRDSDFCELLPFGPRQFPAWGDLLDECLRRTGEDYIRQYILGDMQYDNPYALVMVFEYLREMESSEQNGKTCPISASCLSEWMVKIKECLIKGAEAFTPNHDPNRTRMFLTFVGIADEATAKKVFNRIFPTDESAVDYFDNMFGTNHVFDFTVEEISSYLPKERITQLCSMNCKLQPLFNSVSEYDSQK